MRASEARRALPESHGVAWAGKISDIPTTDAIALPSVRRYDSVGKNPGTSEKTE